MKNKLWFSALALMLALSATCSNAEDMHLNLSPDKTDQQLNALDQALDELKSGARDYRPDERSDRGGKLNKAFVALTGEAVNPLFGVTALGMYNYFKAPEHLRESLPLYDRPVVWVPLLCIIFLMLFNSTICEAFPFLKVPLNALGDIVNKAGAVAVLPLVIKMFADSFAPMAVDHLAATTGTVFPVAFAAEAGVASTAYHSLGWMLGAVIGFIAYGAVWLAFNVIDVLILICPFPGVDAMLKSFRLAVVGILAGTNQIAPDTAVVIAVAVTLVSLFLAGWSFRLSIFGLIFSTDILFFRKKDVAEAPTKAFSCIGMKQARKIPMRTWGRLEKNGKGELVFSYKPWLILSRRETVIGDAGDFKAGRGLLNPFVVTNVDKDTGWLRLPPRYRGQEEALANAFGLKGVVDCGVSGALRSWLSQNFGSGKRVTA